MDLAVLVFNAEELMQSEDNGLAGRGQVHLYQLIKAKGKQAYQY